MKTIFGLLLIMAGVLFAIALITQGTEGDEPYYAPDDEDDYTE